MQLAVQPAVQLSDALSRRWRGQRGRLEVWYATVSDPGSGTGFWVHHELVAPLSSAPYTHGFAAMFRRSGPAILERFGPEDTTTAPSSEIPQPGGTSFGVSSIRGRIGALGWDLARSALEEPSAPLFTFPEWAWKHEVFPAAQILPVASSRLEGTLSAHGEQVRLTDMARGNLAHIYGHGNAERWGWLHAELGGGDVLEIVSAVSRRALLRNLRPLSFVKLRVGGADWPRDPLLCAPLFRAELGLPWWRISGTIGRYRLRAEITIAPERSVSVGYEDPDGETATCTNSEMADADIVLEHKLSRWETEARWTLRSTAHSEIGTRP